ncbi:MAG: histidine--tRNA ligase [Legionellaceae bacterium]|nr:histidine--tRNA ligase [Legionellaceae bacterium]
MVDKIQAIRGMNDILPLVTPEWSFLEQQLSKVLFRYGYQEIRTPVLESTRLFKRSIGEVTDIVEKEMYSFSDRNGDSLTLRPEGTASVVRAAIEHGLLHHQQQKLWYCGPMFRHEKPQKGRYRQFHQLGLEAFGYEDVAVEWEQLLICQQFWQQLGLAEVIQLQVNSIGTLAERQAYKDILIDYFTAHYAALDDDSKRRLDRNPLRILDSKHPDMQELIEAAPQLLDHLQEDSRQRFAELCEGMRELGIPYTVNPRLVRGLDYYGHTVFEWVTDRLGSQATVCAGGRYDALVEQLGGKTTPAFGCAMGLERLLLLTQDVAGASLVQEQDPFVFFVADSAPARRQSLAYAESIRKAFPAHAVVVHLSAGSFKSQFKKADKSKAQYALIVGEAELASDTITVKALRAEEEQQQLSLAELIDWLHKKHQESGD